MTPRTQAAHTPGPWTYREVAENGVLWSYAIESPIREFDERSNIETVAHLTTGIGGEAEANASLIAQAPALLAALEEIVACLEDEPSDATARLPMLRAAIAAARGQS